jgi:hypothetical protein
MAGTAAGRAKSLAAKRGCTVLEFRARTLAGERCCYACAEWKPLTDFAVDRSRADGRAHRCKPCNSRASTRCRYGLTEGDFAKLEAVGACPICERRGVPMEVDHHHETGAVRAILCSRCNSALGMFCEDPALMRRAIAYLEKHNG